MDKGSQLFLLLFKMKAPILSKDPIPIPVLCVSVSLPRHSSGCSRCLHDLRCPRVGATETSTHPAPWPLATAAAAATTAAATTRRTMTSIPPRNPTRTQARSCGYTTRQLFNVYFVQDLLCARVCACLALHFQDAIEKLQFCVGNYLKLKHDITEFRTSSI